MSVSAITNKKLRSFSGHRNNQTMPRVSRFVSSIIFVFVLCSFVLGQISSDSNQTNQKQVKKSSSNTKQKISSQSSNNDEALIIEGKSIGPVHLGDTYEQVLKILPYKPNYDMISEALTIILLNNSDVILSTDPKIKTPPNATKVIKCPKAYDWVSLGGDREEYSVYFENDRVSQIGFITEKYKTKDGIRSYTSPSRIKKIYPNVEAYILRNSGGKEVGRKDLIYLVERQAGIAFELYYDRSERRRLIGRIYVFEPNTDFKPRGCVSPPQSYEKYTGKF